MTNGLQWIDWGHCNVDNPDNGEGRGLSWSIESVEWFDILQSVGCCYHASDSLSPSTVHLSLLESSIVTLYLLGQGQWAQFTSLGNSNGN